MDLTAEQAILRPLPGNQVAGGESAGPEPAARMDRRRHRDDVEARRRRGNVGTGGREGDLIDRSQDRGKNPPLLLNKYLRMT